jgi:hypothetical protein
MMPPPISDPSFNERQTVCMDAAHSGFVVREIPCLPLV